MPKLGSMRNPDVISTDLGDEFLLLDPHTRAMFTLNSTGRVVWQHVEDGVDAIVTILTEQFAIGPEQAQTDVRALIAELVSAGLIVTTD